MLNVATISVSVAFVCTVSFVLVSCLSCRRFIKARKSSNEKKSKKDKKKKKNQLAETKTDLEKGEKPKLENGLPNPAFDDITTSEKESEATGMSFDKEEEANAKCNTANKFCSTIPITEDENSNRTGENDFSEVKIDINSLDRKEISRLTSSNHSSENGPLHEIEEETAFDLENEDSYHEDDEVFDKQNSRNSLKSVTPTSLETAATLSLTNDVENIDGPYDKVMFLGGWRRPVALKHMIEVGLIDQDTADEIVQELKDAKLKMESDEQYEEHIPDKLKKYICGEQPVAGIILETGEKKTIYRSAKEGILRRGTAISLLEAQAATGNIIDPLTGRKMSVKEASELGVLDRVYEAVLLRAERAVTGYKSRVTDEVISLNEAMLKGLVVESHGLRLLQAQYATGGVIDHNINIRVPLDVAVERNLLTERLRKKLEEEGDDQKTFFDPNTEQNVTYKELITRSIVDQDTGLRLYPLERATRRRYYSTTSGRSSLASSRHGSRAGSFENIPSLFSP